MNFEGAFEYFLALSPDEPGDLSSTEDLSFLLDDDLSVAASLLALQALTDKEIFIQSNLSTESVEPPPSQSFTFESLFQDLGNLLVGRNSNERPRAYSFRPLYRAALKAPSAYNPRLLLI